MSRRVVVCPGTKELQSLALSFNVLSCWLSLRAQDNTRQDGTPQEVRKKRKKTARISYWERRSRESNSFPACGAVRFCGIISGDPAGEVFDFGGLFVEVIKTQVFAVASISTLAWKKGAVNPTLACADRKRH